LRLLTSVFCDGRAPARCCGPARSPPSPKGFRLPFCECRRSAALTSDAYTCWLAFLFVWIKGYDDGIVVNPHRQAGRFAGVPKCVIQRYVAQLKAQARGGSCRSTPDDPRVGEAPPPRSVLLVFRVPSCAPVRMSPIRRNGSLLPEAASQDAFWRSAGGTSPCRCRPAVFWRCRRQACSRSSGAR